jgi:hypothetical protein
LKIKAPNKIGTFNGNLSGVEFATNSHSLVTAAASTFIIKLSGKGDVNGDGSINAKDIVDLVMYMMGKKALDLDAADVNGDGVVNSADVILVSNAILNNSNVTSPTEGLVAYYPFNGNANDESGNGNHGSVIGNVELTTDRFGNPNSAYRFFGEPLNYISVPDNESLHCSTFTLNAWVYTDADDYGSGYLINKGRDIGNGTYRLGVRGVGATTEYGGNNDASMEEIPKTKEWHMVTGTVEGDVAKIYLDGVLMNESTLSHPFVYNNTDPLTLGIHYYTGVPDYWAYPLLGILDDVRIYNRVLSPDEIKALYIVN